MSLHSEKTSCEGAQTSLTLTTAFRCDKHFIFGYLGEQPGFEFILINMFNLKLLSE